MKRGSPTCNPQVFRRIFFATGLGFLALWVSSCSTVSVRPVKGSVTKAGIASAEKLSNLPLGAVPDSSVQSVGDTSRELLQKARRLDRSGQKAQAASCYLRVAVEAHEQIAAGNSETSEAAQKALFAIHNHSLARFAELWSTDVSGGEVRKTADSSRGMRCGEDTFEVVMASGNDFPADFFDRAVATESIRGEGVVDKHRKGLGAPLVGIRENLPERAAEMEFFSEKGIFLPITLAISEVSAAPSGEGHHKKVSVALLDPTQKQTFEVGGRSYPLAADFSAPLELLLAGENEIINGLLGFFHAGDRAETSGIFQIEPYDPDRIPVILTHGLISVPIIWRDIIPEILSEPELAKRYQLFAFTYPSSYPITESALLFRTELERLRETYDPGGNDPLSQNMVAMGHSMGGILTHLLVSDMDGLLWDEVASVPLDELPFDAKKKEFFRELTYFDSDPAVQRAVFLSTPHGGAEMATLSLADMVSRLAKLPTDLFQLTVGLAEGPPVEGLKVDIRKKVTSVQSLRPDSPVVLAMNKAPYKPGVVYHSIIGDRGKGDTPDSSDGIVEYWSSHQPGAASELIVPTGHSTYEHPKAIEELKRILRAHAGI